MKVLQISANWGHGGPGGVLKDFHNYLVSKGHEPSVAYGRDDVPNDVVAVKIGSMLDVYVHVLWTRLLDASGFCSSRATRKLIKCIDEMKPDVIHLHNLLGYYLNVEVLFEYLKTAGIPVVWTLHDCWALTGHCINFERIKCEKWKTECHNCQFKDNYPESILFDRSKANFNRKKNAFTNVPNMELIVPSQWLANQVAQSYLREYPCHVINNGIDLEIFKPTCSSIREEYGLQDKKILLFVASVWNEMKGEHLVYQLSDLLDDSYAIVMIGRKSANKIPKRIIDIPRTQNVYELVKWYTAADVFVNPTLGDNLPTVNIEALACGTPVVTNDTGGSPEIAGNEWGRVVYTKQPEEFLKRIDECIEASYAPENCRYAAMRFERDKCFDNYMNVYQNMMRKRLE